MRITSRFTIAIHTLLAIHVFAPHYKVTSEFIASSVNTNPVIIRKILGSLKQAGIVEVKAGSGGASILKQIKDITLYDIYKAVDCVDDELFHFHANPNPACPVGRSIHDVLNVHLLQAQQALENELKQVTLEKILQEYEQLNGVVSSSLDNQ